MAQTRTQPTRFEDVKNLPGALPDHFVKGVDVSHHNGNVDWAVLSAAGVEFAFVKVTEGINTPDPMAQTHALGARQAGLKIGYYHFCRPSPQSGRAAIVADAKAEAMDFKLALRNLPKPDLPPVLDLEADGAAVPAAPTDFLAWVQTFAGELFDPAGVLLFPILYSRAEYLARRLPSNHNLGSICKLWLSRYTADYRQAQPAGGWTDWSIWQFTEAGGLLPTGPLDLNLWRRAEYTDLLQLHRMLAEIRPAKTSVEELLHAAMGNG